MQVFFSAEPGTLSTTLIEIDSAQGTIAFALDADPLRNEAIRAADALAWRTTLGGVRIEFTSGQPQRGFVGATPALVTTLPDILLRLQRRNAFRTAPPITQPMFVMLDTGAKGARETKVGVLDVSALGMCLLVDSNALHLTGGMRIARARFELPGFGEIRCGLEVRYILSAGAKHPAHFRRCGVQFAGLASADAVLVARYIDTLQRQRVRARFD